jgi:hypothetical protein
MYLSPILIPIIALSIPLVAVLGRVIVQPITKAVMHLAEIQAGDRSAPALSDHRAAELEARLDRIEQVLGRLADDYEFRQALEAPAPRSIETAKPSGAVPGPR